eukprot:XP_020407819.1 circumsporozoite protein-like [Zea mays]
MFIKLNSKLIKLKFDRRVLWCCACGNVLGLRARERAGQAARGRSAGARGYALDRDYAGTTLPGAGAARCGPRPHAEAEGPLAGGAGEPAAQGPRGPCAGVSGSRARGATHEGNGEPRHRGQGAMSPRPGGRYGATRRAREAGQGRAPRGGAGEGPRCHARGRGGAAPPRQGGAQGRARGGRAGSRAGAPGGHAQGRRGRT